MKPIPSIHVATTTERKTEPGRFGSALRNAAAGAAHGIAASVELAAPYVPGGTVLSAAVRGCGRHPHRPGRRRRRRAPRRPPRARETCSRPRARSSSSPRASTSSTCSSRRTCSARAASSPRSRTS